MINEQDEIQQLREEDESGAGGGGGGMSFQKQIQSNGSTQAMHQLQTVPQKQPDWPPDESAAIDETS